LAQGGEIKSGYGRSSERRGELSIEICSSFRDSTRRI
jgi:hypothetical protein